MSRYAVDTHSDDGERLTFEDVEWIAEHTDLPPHIIVFLHELVLRREQGQPLELPPPTEPAEPEYLGGDDLPPEELNLGDELTLADLEWFEAHPDCSPYVVETLARVIAEREKRRAEEAVQPIDAAAEEAVVPAEPVSAPESAEELPEEALDEPPAPAEIEPEEEAEEPAPEGAGQASEESESEPGEEALGGDSQLTLGSDDAAPADVPGEGEEDPADVPGEGEEPDGKQGDADEQAAPDTLPEEGSVVITDGAKALAEAEGFDLSGLINARQLEPRQGKKVKITRASVTAALKEAAEAS